MKSKSFDQRVESRRQWLIPTKTEKCPLSTKEIIQKIRDCQIAIKHNSLKAGEWLIIIRDEERWEITHDSFYKFCEEYFNISKTYVYDLIEGVSVWRTLSDSNQQVITNEGQVRELRKAPEIARNEIVEQAKKFGAVTATNLRQSFTEIKHKFPDASFAVANGQPPESSSKPKIYKPQPPSSAKPEPVRDWEKNIVPPEALAFWERRNDFWKHRRGLDDLVEHFEKILVPGDFVRAKLPDDLLERIKKVIADLMLIEFYCVCPKCKGEPSTKPEGCSFCFHTGVISKIEFDKLGSGLL